MKTTLIALLSLALIACQKTYLPEVTLLEVGNNNSKTATIGGDLHLEAEMIADSKIANIRLVIHPEDEEEQGGGGPSSSNPYPGWELDTTFTGVYVNVRNTIFHEDISIPATIAPGHYHVDLILTDQEGHQGRAEVELELVNATAGMPYQIIQF